MKFWVIIPAAGSGQRFGSDLAKQFQQVRGRSVLDWTLSRFLDHPDLAGIQVVLPAGVEPFNHWNSDLIRCCVGGQTRRDSVLAGCRALLEQGVDKDTPVLVHDAARPLLPQNDLNQVLSAVQSGPACLVAPVADTLRTHQGETLDRDRIFRVLTPQAASLDALVSSLDIDHVFTDEVAYLQAAGHQVTPVIGDPVNLKITWPKDIRWAEIYLNELD